MSTGAIHQAREMSGWELISTPTLNKGTAFTQEELKKRIEASQWYPEYSRIQLPETELAELMV